MLAQLYITLLYDVLCVTCFYYRSGPNRWRDYAKPVEILETLCKLREFDPLEWDGTSKVKFHNHTYCLSDFGKRIIII